VGIQVIRWLARAWAAVSIGLIALLFVGEGFRPSQVNTREWVGLLFFPVGVCAGMILAWWREGLGGGITVASLLAFYTVHLVTTGTLPSGWAWLVFAAPGFLFLLCWRRSRGTGEVGPGA
jgi:hypothetical protein